MTRKLTSATNLDSLRKEARRWLNALRGSDAKARERLERAYPKAPPNPVLRDVQHALAGEFGFENWKLLKLALQSNITRTVHPNFVARFLEYACPDHHVRGLPAHRMACHGAMRLLESNPAIALNDIYTAGICGEVEEVRRILRERPELATTKRSAAGLDRSGAGSSWDFLGDFGTKQWEPLLYLCFARLPLPKALDNAVAIARILLDAGADVNACFTAGDSRYTPLVGVIGEGEENRPPHPRRDELVRLLLEHGAEPYDSQVVYNIHFQGKVLWWLKLMHEFSVKAGRAVDWADSEWHMLDQGGYGSGARWHLRIAVEQNDTELAQWCLTHGANPNAAPELDSRFPRHSLYEYAVRLGRVEIADLLLQHGAETADVTLDHEDRFVTACLRLDRNEMQSILAAHPDYLQSTKAIFVAAHDDRADVAALLLEIGTPIEVEDAKKQRTLHVAASSNSWRVAQLLIERGAEVDPYEQNYNNTPLGFAVNFEHHRMIDLLSPHSRDIWNLTFTGNVERVRQILTAEPQLAKASSQTTPLFWLPENEADAIQLIRLFLTNGANANFRNRKDGSTAAELARKRGLNEAAAILGSAADACERLARELVAVYDSGDAAALELLQQHYRSALSVSDVRARVHQKIERIRQAIENGENPNLDLAEARELIAQEAPLTATERGSELHARERYTQAAQDFVDAFEGDVAALERLNQHYERSFSFDDLTAEIWRRVYAFRQRSSKVPKNYLLLSEAQIILAQDAGFSSWTALMQAIGAGAVPHGLPYVIDAKDSRISPRRRMTRRDWDQLIDVLRESRLTGLDAGGYMTDEALERVAELDHVTSLNLGGSRELTDSGLRHLARMPQLQHLELSEHPGGKITDRGLEVLRQLPNLRTFEMTWQKGISDIGAANLRYCEQLESVNLMGSPTGDGVIEALQGKPSLRRFSTGRLVTDAGLPMLQNFPMFKRWHGAEDGGAHLLIDGPFSDDGLASLAGLEGVYELDLFWYVQNITSHGFAHLLQLSNLGSLGCDGKLSDDVAMGYIAAMPRLRKLRAQESVATEDGFVALSRSKTIEHIWGRECPNFGSRSFVALSRMPALRGFGIGCAHVDDAALSTLPHFSALQELTPIGFKDDGFRHVGRCRKLQRLTCMYCRETTDIATGHISELRLNYYYAGLTKITDLSLEILGRIPTLEQIDLYECDGVTDAGLPFLAALPNLREVHLDSLPGVTLEGTRVFPAGVRVYYST